MGHEARGLTYLNHDALKHNPGVGDYNIIPVSKSQGPSMGLKYTHK